MKKISFLFLALALVVTLSACTKETKNPNANQAAPEQTGSQTNTPTEAQTANQTDLTVPNTVNADVANNGTSATNTETPAENQPANPGLLQISLAEIKLHSKPADCWLAIDGRVFDVTPYIKLGIHPGGEKILNGCGLDASEIFASVDKHDNGKARPMLEKYVIGNLMQ